MNLGREYEMAVAAATLLTPEEVHKRAEEALERAKQWAYLMGPMENSRGGSGGSVNPQTVQFPLRSGVTLR